MKNIKLKFLMMAAVVLLLGSCSSNENLTKDEPKATTSSDFVMEHDMHYIVNGQLTSDKDFIEASQKDAWNIHQDYSTGKVVISTTPAEFEKYKNSDLGFKQRFEAPNLNTINQEESSKQAKVTYNQYDGINYTDHLVFYIHNSSNSQYVIFPVTTVNDINIGFNAHYISSNGTTYLQTWNVFGSGMFDPARRGVNDDTYIRNTANTAKTITFYNGTNLTGTSGSITFGFGTYKRIINRNTVKSYK